jgi:DNA-binding NtrC family response regulator
MALNFKISTPGSSTAGGSAASTRTLLVVDDDHAMLFTLRSLFQRQGWHLLEADNVAEAMKLWDANHRHIDAVVTDYQFNGTQTGLDLVMFVQGRQKGFPCVVISGTWVPEKTPRDEPQNNVFYRAKPFDMRELLDLLNRISAPGTPAPK